MAERQETSVMVSIQEILQDAQSREEQEKVVAEQRARETELLRLEDIRRKQEDEAARMRAEEEERSRRAFEEEKRHAELRAVQEATIHRAKAEAESQARLAEMTARQDHERQIHALSQDKHKRRVQMIAIALGVFFFVGAVGAGVVIKRTVDEKDAAVVYARQLEADKQEVEQQQTRLKTELAQTQDPAQIAALQAKLAAKEQELTAIAARQNQPARVAGPVGGAPAAAKKVDKPPPKCNCTPGDPLCSCL